MSSLNFSLIFFSLLFTTTLTFSPKQTYIVHLKPHQQQQQQNSISHKQWFTNHLISISSDSDPSESLLYVYSTAYNGFSASLTQHEADSLRNSDNVVGVYKDDVYTLHTTRTPEFLGLGPDSTAVWAENLERVSSDVIVGVLDTGVWPESRSFLDSGMPSIPPFWKGECEAGPDFSPNACNKKLVGARMFSKGYMVSGRGDALPSPRDYDGHGTHTASTAAGAHAANASLFGYAKGTARGMATGARVASYKVCWKGGCMGSDILAGMEKAMEDGVSVLSMSLGGGSTPYYRDTIAVGAFAAVEKGIFVSCSAGNSGPRPSSLANLAPWIMTVGAGTLDRNFPAYALLGNRKLVTGVSLYSGKGMGKKPVELVYNKGTNGSSNLCLAGSLDSSLVKGKVVLCDRGITARVEKGLVVRDAGGVGMILANSATNGEELVADSHLLPAVAVGKRVGDMVRDYVMTGRRPTAVLSFGGTVLGIKPSPVVAAFSSRGPNVVTPQILKPDLIGPGVNILAGWSEAIGPTGLDQDTRKTQFNIMSGTSMSCPHISGLAALLKAAHPDWSPSAIKSALMTTAYTLDSTNSPLRDAAQGSLSTPFAHGSGHVDPHRAISPGLVYDLSTNDYIAFLCSIGYTAEHIQTITKRSNFTCSRKFNNPGQLNYPSFSVIFGRKRVVRYTRVLTNVGKPGAIYNVAVTGPASITVKVKPAKLVFNKVGDKCAYTVTFVSDKGGNETRIENNAFGSLSWNNAEHQVRSPIAYAWAMF